MALKEKIKIVQKQREECKRCKEVVGVLYRYGEHRDGTRIYSDRMY